VLQIENAADDAVPSTHNQAIHRALATTDKEYVRIEGATHYYLGQPDHLRQCIDTVKDWSHRKNLLRD
jgi:alpha/beta superfamily hydrolase